MSRIGKKEIEIPSGVDVNFDGAKVVVKGAKGSLERVIHSTMDLNVADGKISVLPRGESRDNGKFQGLTRSLVNNMVLGVSQGFSKTLTLIGVGYRAAVEGKKLNLTLGYSHPVLFEIPEGVDIKVEKLTTVIVSGFDKEKVGQAAADIRSFRKPEPYHGKGVRYSDEVIVTKVGKAAGKK